MNEFVVKDDNKLTVGIGWDAKKVDLKKKIKIAIDSIMSATSEDTYDLNLAAIVEHNDGSDPELVFWGHKYSRSDSVVLKGDEGPVKKKELMRRCVSTLTEVKMSDVSYSSSTYTMAISTNSVLPRLIMYLHS